MEKQLSNNSFYNLGGMEILTFAQDEESGLYKIYLSTPEHYVVSREFDKSKGLYANAPEAVIRKGLMDFSDSLIGNDISLWKIMDMFIDRCFDDSVFDKYTENAIWLCIDYPSYLEVEDILNTYSCRIKWFDKDDINDEMGECLNTALYKLPTGEAKQNMIRGLKKGFKRYKITAAFMNKDTVAEKLIMDKEFEDFPIFMGEFSDKDNQEFVSFRYLKH